MRDESQDIRDLIEKRIDAAEYLRRIELRLLERRAVERRAYKLGFWSGVRSVFWPWR
jgi:hypothetical protein